MEIGMYNSFLVRVQIIKKTWRNSMGKFMMNRFYPNHFHADSSVLPSSPASQVQTDPTASAPFHRYIFQSQGGIMVIQNNTPLSLGYFRVIGDINIIDWFLIFSILHADDILAMDIQWLVVSTPLKISVNWDDYSQYMGKQKCSNHQHVQYCQCYELYQWFYSILLG